MLEIKSHKIYDGLIKLEGKRSARVKNDHTGGSVDQQYENVIGLSRSERVGPVNYLEDTWSFSDLIWIILHHHDQLL